MRLYAYVVARDYGFAPNPFFGICTLANCKPVIRRVAQIGDWIVGTGSKAKNREKFFVFAMQVDEALTFSQYWHDSRFRRKQPNLRGSLKQAYGDNIYHLQPNGSWHQRNSHHSFENGVVNARNVRHDTQTDRVLIGKDFVYWGGHGPKIESVFGKGNDRKIRALRGHKSRFPSDVIHRVAEWFWSLEEHGYLGQPLEWDKLYD